jgi:hypothetical protein
MRLTPRQAARLESFEAELDAAPADHRRVIALKATGVMFAASGSRRWSVTLPLPA